MTILRKKMYKNYQKSQIKGAKTYKKHVNIVKLHDFSSLGVQDFAQTQQNCARSHDCVTVTFRNSAPFPLHMHLLLVYCAVSVVVTQ